MSGPALQTAFMNIAVNEDWMVPFLYQQVDVNGNVLGPVDLTGTYLKMMIRSRDVDHEVFVSVWSKNPIDPESVNNGIIIYNDPTQGQFYVWIDREKLTRLAPGSYVADLIHVLANGTQDRLIDADVTAVTGVTRP
jgi:hypothetical protein